MSEQRSGGYTKWTRTIRAWHCCFCGGALRRGRRPARFRCEACRAAFRLERNERGCAVRVEIDDCGAGPVCCRIRQQRSQNALDKRRSLK